jgi:hypothetical protein
VALAPLRRAEAAVVAVGLVALVSARRAQQAAKATVAARKEAVPKRNSRIQAYHS